MSLTRVFFLLLAISCAAGGALSCDSAEVHIRWSFTTGGALTYAPKIGPDGTIYAGSTDGRLYAIVR